MTHPMDYKREAMEAAWQEHYDATAPRCEWCECCTVLDKEDNEGILTMDAGLCSLSGCLVPTPRIPTEIARECLGG